MTACPDRLVPPERNVSGTPARLAATQQPADLRRVARHHHRLRDEQEVRGVVGVGEPVDGAGAHVGDRIGQSIRERHGATTIPPGTSVDTRRTVPPAFPMFRSNAVARPECRSPVPS